MNKKINSCALLLLLITPTTLLADTKVSAGIGEYKNREPTSSTTITWNNQHPSSRLFWELEYNDVKADYDRHDYSEVLVGGGVNLIHGLTGQAVMNDETYKGSLRARAPLNHNTDVFAGISHKNEWGGGLKRTQAEVGLGFDVVKGVSIDVGYRTGNFHSDYVSDQLLVGVRWGH